MGELVPTLHAPCRMHQLCLVLVAVMKRSGLMSALFCACNLLRKKRVQTRIRNNLLILVEARLIVDFDEGPTEEAKTEVKAALSFLEQAIASASLAEGEDAQSRSKRLSALQRLRCFLGGRISAIELRHPCPHRMPSFARSLRQELPCRHLRGVRFAPTTQSSVEQMDKHLAPGSLVCVLHPFELVAPRRLRQHPRPTTG